MTTVTKEQHNMELMQTLDDAWNSQDMETFTKRHKSDVAIARFTGTMKGAMRGPDGTEVPPTGKSFDVEFCTVARWDNDQVVEENLFYDLVTFMRQIGLGT